MTIFGLTGNKLEVANALAEVSRRGPVMTTSRGDMAVGKTLMDLLGIQQKTASKPLFKGVVLTTRRNTGGGNGNRVNLFAKVPNWNVSACKRSLITTRIM